MVFSTNLSANLSAILFRLIFLFCILEIERVFVETEIENMLNGKESAEDAVRKMASDMNKSIEDYNLLNE